MDRLKPLIPPIKSQGIKTKLLPHLAAYIPGGVTGRWIEPFMGTGVVGFNLAPRGALMCDANPHLINFYQALADGGISPGAVRRHLSSEGGKLLRCGEEHYYAVRDRFNETAQPLDFLFLNRACFNGMIRFNRRGEFNTPFCRKPQRFLPAYISKITNQTAAIANVLRHKHFVFKCQPFEQTIAESAADDIIYCDPPYIDRHADYYNGWDEARERKLHQCLSGCKGRFFLSTWHHNIYRENRYISDLWGGFHVQTREHFYHLGGHESNRNSMTEAIISNYAPPETAAPAAPAAQQAFLLETPPECAKN